MSADSIEQTVRFLRDRDLARHVRMYGSPDATTVHHVTEFRPELWIVGNDWGLTLRTTDGHEVEVTAEVIAAAHAATYTHGPIPCRRPDCDRIADPDDVEQSCVDHRASRRFP